MRLDRRVRLEAYEHLTNQVFEVVGAELVEAKTIWAHREKVDEVMEEPDARANHIRLANVGKRRYTIRPAPFIKEWGKTFGFRNVFLIDEDGERWYVQEIDEDAESRRRWWTLHVESREATGTS